MNNHAPIAASEIVKAAIESGAHPSEIRRVLQEQGIRWQYSITGQGERERARRRRQFRLCSEGCGRHYHRDSSINMCVVCLDEKWAEHGSASVVPTLR